MKVTKIKVGAREQVPGTYRGYVCFWVNGIKLNWYETCPDIGIDRNDALKHARKLRKTIIKDLELLEVPFVGTPCLT